MSPFAYPSGAPPATLRVDARYARSLVCIRRQRSKRCRRGPYCARVPCSCWHLPAPSRTQPIGGIYTVVDGDVRVLRGTLWYRLEPGARAENGDVVDAGEHAQVQLELSRAAR